LCHALQHGLLVCHTMLLLVGSAPALHFFAPEGEDVYLTTLSISDIIQRWY